MLMSNPDLPDNDQYWDSFGATIRMVPIDRFQPMNCSLQIEPCEASLYVDPNMTNFVMERNEFANLHSTFNRKYKYNASRTRTIKPRSRLKNRQCRGFKQCRPWKLYFPDIYIYEPNFDPHEVNVYNPENFSFLPGEQIHGEDTTICESYFSQRTTAGYNSNSTFALTMSTTRCASRTVRIGPYERTETITETINGVPTSSDFNETI